MPVGNCTEEEVGYEVDTSSPTTRYPGLAVAVVVLGALAALAGLVLSKPALAAAGAVALVVGGAVLYHLRRRHGTKEALGTGSPVQNGPCGKTLDPMAVSLTPSEFTSGDGIRYYSTVNSSCELIVKVEVNAQSCEVSYPYDGSRPNDTVPVSLPLTHVDLYKNGGDYGVFLRSSSS